MYMYRKKNYKINKKSAGHGTKKKLNLSCSLQGRHPHESTAVGYCHCRDTPAVAHGSAEVVVEGVEQRHAVAVEERGGVESCSSWLWLFERCWSIAVESVVPGRGQAEE